MKYFRSLIENVKAFAASSIIVGGGITGYFYFVTQSNLKRYHELTTDTRYKDTTRPSNEFFGINWGYRADYMIKERIDTGDILYLKYECGNSLNLTDLVKCYWQQTWSSDQEYDAIALAYRNNLDLYIVYDDLGNMKIDSYAEFLSKPYFQEISMRKLLNKTNTAKQLRQIYKGTENFINDLAGNVSEPKEIKAEFRSMTLGQIILNYLYEIDALDKEDPDILKYNISINDLDIDNPLIFNKYFYLDKKLVIRSKSNLDLIV